MTVSGESGVALLLTMMAMLLLSVLAAAMVLSTSTESAIAASFRNDREAFYAAEAVGEWALAELATRKDDWTAIVNGMEVSSFTDGPPAGTRIVSGQPVADLTSIRAANTGWQLFAWGAFADLVRSPSASQFYIVALVASDTSSLDGLLVRALALGPRGAFKTVELQIRRSARGVHVISWKEGP